MRQNRLISINKWLVILAGIGFFFLVIGVSVYFFYSDSNNDNRLLRYVAYHDLFIVHQMLSSGADPNKVIEGRTVLFHAAFQGDKPMVTLLLQYGADPNFIDNLGLSPLQCTLLNSDPTDKVGTIKILLEKGADVDFKSKLNGITTLMMASEYGQIEVVKLLIDSKADLNILDNAGNSALIYAIKKHQVQIVELLVKGKANVYLKTKEEKTAIQIAEELGYSDILKILQAKVN